MNLFPGTPSWTSRWPTQLWWIWFSWFLRETRAPRTSQRPASKKYAFTGNPIQVKSSFSFSVNNSAWLGIFPSQRLKIWDWVLKLLLLWLILLFTLTNHNSFYCMNAPWWQAEGLKCFWLFLGTCHLGLPLRDVPLAWRGHHPGMLSLTFVLRINCSLFCPIMNLPSKSTAFIDKLEIAFCNPAGISLELIFSILRIWSLAERYLKI